MNELRRQLKDNPKFRRLYKKCFYLSKELLDYNKEAVIVSIVIVDKLGVNHGLSFSVKQMKKIKVIDKTKIRKTTSRRIKR